MLHFLVAAFCLVAFFVFRRNQDFPEHRLKFFRLLKAVNTHCFKTLFEIPPEHQKLVVDSVVWAFKHTERNIGTWFLASRREDRKGPCHGIVALEDLSWLPYTFFCNVSRDKVACCGRLARGRPFAWPLSFPAVVPNQNSLCFAAEKNIEDLCIPVSLTVETKQYFCFSHTTSRAPPPSWLNSCLMF